MQRLTMVLLVTLLVVPAAWAHDWNDIAINRAGDIFVVDADYGEIWKIAPNGKVETFVSKQTGEGCNHPHHLSMDAHDTLWFGSG